MGSAASLTEAAGREIAVMERTKRYGWGLALALLLGACGGGGTTAAPSASAGAAAPGGSATAAAAKKPTTAAELAMYKGADRQQILEEGAKAEGTVVLYTSNSGIETLAKELEKKYPFLKVNVLRAQNTAIQKRVGEELAANKLQADVIESSGEGIGQMIPQGFFQEWWSPELAGFPDYAVSKGKNGGAIVIADREIYSGIAWNTKIINSAEVPKKLDDLLDPKWKGKMGIVNTSSGVNWMGEIQAEKGLDFIKKLAAQEFKVQSTTAAALTDLVVSGEIPMSPVIGWANVQLAKKKGAPIEWYPMEPVDTTIGSSGLTVKPPHPHAALLLLDFIHSKAGQEQAFALAGLVSPRSDIPSKVGGTFRKIVLSQAYTPEQYEKAYSGWEQTFRQLFLASR